MTWYVVDGMDGSGKTTVGEMLMERLEGRGRKVVLVNHPNPDSAVGRMDAKFLTVPGKVGKVLSTVFYILDVLNSLAHKRGLERRYDDVIFVRYIMAVSYLSDEKTAKRAYRLIEGILPMPDRKIFVDVDADTALARIDSRGETKEIFETKESLEKTRRNMLSLTDGWTVIDNSKGIENTQGQIDDFCGKRI